jgi:hypothetical protein
MSVQEAEVVLVERAKKHESACWPTRRRGVGQRHGRIGGERDYLAALVARSPWIRSRGAGRLASRR